MRRAVYKTIKVSCGVLVTLHLAVACKPASNSRSFGYGKDMSEVKGTQGAENAVPNTEQPTQTATTTNAQTTPVNTTTTNTVTPPPSANTTGEKIIEAFVGGSYRPFDVIITWDDSGSMLDDLEKMEKNVRDFVINLNTKKLDAKVVMMGVGFDFPNDLDNFRTLSRPIGSHNTLKYLLEYLQTADAVRKDTAIDVVMITDDNAAAPETLAAQMPKDIAGTNIRYNSVIGLKAGTNNATCVVKNVGTEYKTLSTQSGGLVIDICDNDMGSLLSQLFDKLTLINQVYKLKEKVDTKVQPTVTVDGKAIDKADFEIDAAASTLKIADKVLTHEKAEISIEYVKLK